MSFVQDKQGQGLAEYAFLLSLVVLVVIVVVFLFGISVEDLYNDFVPTLVAVFS